MIAPSQAGVATPGARSGGGSESSGISATAAEESFAAGKGPISRRPRRNRIRPLDAFRALRALARSGGTDYAQAAAFMKATEGRSGQRTFARFLASECGARLSRRRPSLRDTLDQDRGALAILPSGTLGRAYHDFMAANAFSLEALAELGRAGHQRPMQGDEEWFTDRMNALHDLRHVIVGYGREALGELCLVAYRFAEVGHPGMAFFAVAWGLKLVREQRGQPVVAAIMEAYRRGRDSVWMDDLDWEAMLSRPVTEIRAMLNLAPPSVYDRITTSRSAA